MTNAFVSFSPVCMHEIRDVTNEDSCHVFFRGASKTMRVLVRSTPRPEFLGDEFFRGVVAIGNDVSRMNRRTRARIQNAHAIVRKTRSLRCLVTAFFVNANTPAALSTQTFCFSRTRNQCLFQIAACIIPMTRRSSRVICTKDVSSKAASKGIQNAYVSVYACFASRPSRIHRTFNAFQRRTNMPSFILFFRNGGSSSPSSYVVAFLIFPSRFLCVATGQLDRPRFERERRNTLEINLRFHF